MTTKKTLLALLLCGVCAVVSAHAAAQAARKSAEEAFPTRPIRIVVPFPAGGSTSLAEIRAGTLRALATTASKRIATLPDVPTVRELGYPALEAEGWNGLFAPAKTPKAVIARLNKEVVAAVRHPDTVKRLNDLAAEPVGSSPEAQLAILLRQMDQFRPIIKEMKLD